MFSPRSSHISGHGHRVWKFGGSSLANAERIQQVVRLILDHGLKSSSACYIRGNNNDSLVVVVSAIAGVTNLLVRACATTSKTSHTFVLEKLSVLDEIVMKHQCLIADLIKRNALDSEKGNWMVEKIKSDCFSKIRSLLEACSIIGNVPVKISEIIKGFGEIWSSMICSLCMQYLILTTKSNDTLQSVSQQVAELGSAECPDIPVAFEESTTRPVDGSNDDSEAGSNDDAEDTIHLAILSSPWNCQTLIQLQKPFLADENPTVDMDLSKKLIAAKYSNEREIWAKIAEALAKERGVLSKHIRLRCISFATGYVCRDYEGASATLGRNGSDYTGAILANCLSANSYTIWSDVEGVFTADPRIISEARCVPVLTYEEAMELSFFGASVIHPLTMQPLISADIPIFMKSSYFPNKIGTVICRVGRTEDLMTKSRMMLESINDKKADDNRIKFAGVPLDDLPCKSITTIGGISTLTILGTVMTAKRGLTRRMFATLDELDIQVLMVCQASSDYGVSLAIKTSEVTKAVAGLEKEFFGEMIRCSTFKIKVDSDLAMLCTVGEGQRNKVGYFANVTAAIAEVDTSIISCVQSPSERLIAFVIQADDREKVVRQLHRVLFPHLNEAQQLPEGNAKAD